MGSGTAATGVPFSVHDACVLASNTPSAVNPSVADSPGASAPFQSYETNVFTAPSFDHTAFQTCSTSKLSKVHTTVHPSSGG